MSLLKFFAKRTDKADEANANASANSEQALDEILMTQDRKHITQRLVRMGRWASDMLTRSLDSVSIFTPTSADDAPPTLTVVPGGTTFDFPPQSSAQINNGTEGQVARDIGGVLRDDSEINRLELEIDWECLTAIAMRNPVQDQLRFLFVVFKMTTDLERLGDEACNIVRHLLWHHELIKSLDDLADVRDLLSFAVQQLDNVLTAFENEDLDLARKVYEGDDKIDKFYLQTYNDFLSGDYAKDNANKEMRQQAYILTLVRHIERIGDHIANIAEYVCYLLTGEHINETHSTEPRKHSRALADIPSDHLDLAVSTAQ